VQANPALAAEPFESVPSLASLAPAPAVPPAHLFDMLQSSEQRELRCAAQAGSNR